MEKYAGGSKFFTIHYPLFTIFSYLCTLIQLYIYNKV